MRGLPLTSPVAAGMLGETVQTPDPLVVVPKPPPIGDWTPEPPPRGAQATRQYLQTIGPRLSAMARRDSQAARLWWGSFAQYYNANRDPDSVALNLSDFDRLVR